MYCPKLDSLRYIFGADFNHYDVTPAPKLLNSVKQRELTGSFKVANFGAS